MTRFLVSHLNTSCSEGWFILRWKLLYRNTNKKLFLTIYCSTNIQAHEQYRHYDIHGTLSIDDVNKPYEALIHSDNTQYIKIYKHSYIVLCGSVHSSRPCRTRRRKWPTMPLLCPSWCCPLVVTAVAGRLPQTVELLL